MTQVETVLGPVEGEELGLTLMHEHIFVKNPELESSYPSPHWNEAAAIERARTGLSALAGKGVGTIVDLTVLGLGRDVARIEKVADGIPINIVVATGLYSLRDLPAFFKSHGRGLWIDEGEPLEEMFLGDIRDGIAGTGVKAAIVKVSTDAAGVTPGLERVLRAAVVAQRETGVPISTHTNASVHGGRDQQAIFRDAGADLERVVIGHCGDTTDIDYLRELMDNGSYIGMDRFGMDWILPEEDRIETIVKLCEAGYAERMTISHDAAFYSVNSEPPYRAQRGPNWHHAHVVDAVLPKLRERGVSDAQIDRMMVVNPRRILTGES